ELQALAQGVLRPPALGAARKKAHDEAALHEEQSGAARDVPLVEVPGRRRPKADDAAHRQPSLVESPALELPPVEHVPVGSGLDDGNALGTLSAEDSQPDLRSLTPVCVETIDVAAHRSPTEELVQRHIAGSVGGPSDSRQRIVGDERAA